MNPVNDPITGDPIPVDPITGDPIVNVTGELKVCVTNGTDPVLSGIVRVEGVAGDFILLGDLESPDPYTSPGAGCYIFAEIPAGKIVSVSMGTGGTGCLAPSAQTKTIVAGQQQTVNFALDCSPGNIGYLKVKVLGISGEVLTDNASLTVWTEDGTIVPGTGFALSLDTGTGGYSEEIPAPANTPLYVWVKALPLGYLDHKSSTFTISADEHKAFTVHLNDTTTLPPDDDDDDDDDGLDGLLFVGVSSPSVLQVNQPFNISIDTVMYNQMEITDQLANVRAVLDGQTYPMSYQGGDWKVALLAPPTSGVYDIVLRGSYNN
jgi:hypothetical protein